jgi:hypothetical protein
MPLSGGFVRFDIFGFETPCTIQNTRRFNSLLLNQIVYGLPGNPQPSSRLRYRQVVRRHSPLYNIFGSCQRKSSRKPLTNVKGGAYTRFGVDGFPRGVHVPVTTGCDLPHQKAEEETER